MVFAELTVSGNAPVPGLNPRLLILTFPGVFIARLAAETLKPGLPILPVVPAALRVTVLA